MLVEVGGHCDTVGSLACNDDLSLRRARAVTAWLIFRGVPAERLVYTGYGERAPMVATPDETREALNRRVVFTVLVEDDAELAGR